MRGMKTVWMGAIVLLAAVPAGAAVLFDSAGFESPTYTAGALSGQNGWSSAGEYTVENNPANAYAGSQYLNAASGGGSAGAIENFTTSTGSVVTATARFRLDSGANHWIDFQLREGDNSSFAAFGFQNLENGFTNDIVYRDAVAADGGTGAYIALAKYTPDTWFEIRLELDMVNNNWDVFLNNAQIANNLPRRVSAADSISRLTIDREPTNGSFRIDDLVIGDPIPEPTTGAIVSTMALGLLARRCHHKKSGDMK